MLTRSYIVSIPVCQNPAPAESANPGRKLIFLRFSGFHAQSRKKPAVKSGMKPLEKGTKEWIYMLSELLWKYMLLVK